MSKIPFVSGVDMSAEYNAALLSRLPLFLCRLHCKSLFSEKRIEETFIKQKLKNVNMIARDVSTTETTENAVDALGNTSK